MKKLFYLTFFLLLISILVACGDNESEANGENSSDNPKTLKIGSNTPEDSTRGAAAEKFKNVVEEKTDGEVAVEVYHNEELGSEQEMLEQVQAGSLDMQLLGGSAIQNIVPEYSVLALPFMVEDFDEAYAVLDGEIGDKLKEKAYDEGFKILEHSDLGMVQLTNSKHPIKHPDDLEGLKMRSPDEPTSISTFEQLGASPNTMPLTEVYMGLEQSVIDGQFNPLDAIYENNFHEVQDYLTLANIFYYHVNITMNGDLYDSMDSELQKIVDEASVEAQSASRDYTQKQDEEMLDILKEEEAFDEIEEDIDIEEFRSKIDYEEFYDFVGEDIIKETQEFIEDYREENN